MGNHSENWRDIASGWIGNNWALGCSKDDAGRVTYTHDTIQTAALLDIARSLRTLANLAQCPNVARGYQGMAALATLLQGKQTRTEKVLRTKVRNLRKKLKAAALHK